MTSAESDRARRDAEPPAEGDMAAPAPAPAADGGGDGEARAERRARRRAARRARIDDSIPSPCIAVCQIDDSNGFCLGCFRSIDEIRDWPIMSAEEKTATLARIAERKAVSGATPGATGP